MGDSTTTNDWVRLLEEMEALAEELTTAGWETLTIAAGDAAPVLPETSDLDQHGYAYVIPGDDAERFSELFAPDGFTETDVYRSPGQENLYLLTVLRDPGSEVAILLAGVLDRAKLGDCQTAAKQSGRMYTHVLQIDGTHLGSFVHEDPEPFFP